MMPTAEAQVQAVAALTTFYRGLDHSDSELTLRFTAKNLVWHRQGVILENREAILEALSKRSRTMRVAHLLLNPQAELLAPDSMLVRAYLMILAHDSGEVIEGAAPLTGVRQLRPIQARFEKEADQWMLAHLEGETPMFSDAVAP